MQTLAPIQSNEREIFMDVLRGFAILGIFIANLNSFSFYEEGLPPGPYLLPEGDHTMSFLHHMFLEGKFYSIFSLLFGWGIALQIKRGLDAGSDPLPTVRRRLFFMLLLGAMHLMIWTGDIVFFYAILAFILLPLRKFSNRTLLITGGILILSPILLYWLKMTWPVLNYPAEQLGKVNDLLSRQLLPEFQEINSREQLVEALKRVNWWDVLKNNIAGAFGRFSHLLIVSRVPKVLGMFLIGYALGRSGFYSNIVQHKKTVYIMIAVGLLIGLPANYFLAQQMQDHMGDYFQFKLNGLYQTIFYTLGVVPLSLAYVGLFMLAFKTKPGHKILSLLAPAGKMAFSNYIMQSLIGNFFFFSSGLDYMWKVGPVYYTLFGIAVFIGQVIVSTIWLKYFNYGPVEWLWRSATYKKWQPFRKRPMLL
ncbi:MAG: DUF418 domain-containing protein [Chitinophagaceae bacterium]|nr:DUF418 domain-containing protein [Chitinophagaceae bacterium]